MATELRHRPARRLLSATRATRQRGIPAWARLFTVIAAVGAALFAVQFGAFAATRIGVGIQIDGQDAQVTVDGNRQRIHLPATPTQVMFVPGSPLLREYQIDGTDDSNNFTEDVGYIERMVDQPYFGFQDWMRDSASYSSWRGITVRTSGGRQEVLAGGEHGTDSDRVELPTSSGAPTVVTAALMRLEIPAELLVVCGADPCAAITINRNDRYVRAVLLLPDGTSVGQSQAFFPVQALPFAAEIVYLLAHVALWSLALFVVLIALHASLSLAVTALKRHTLAIAAGSGVATGGWRVRSWWTRGFVWDRLAMATVALSFGFTCYIALVQYHAEPHILDASAYLMQAKIFASGHLSAPVPANLSAFQGPFMVAHDGRWFSQYAPGTSLLLAAGYLLHLPWIVEPLLGSLALWGLYRLGQAWYGGVTGWLAVLLGALSPFYSYLAAAYLSHVPALFFEVFALLWFTRYMQEKRTRDVILAAGCWCGLLLTRELSAVLLGAGVVAIFTSLHARRLWAERARVARAIPAALVAVLCGSIVYLLYNRLQTGSALTTPRALFSPADRLGFGAGIGFYGQHTLAAGLVNLSG